MKAQGWGLLLLWLMSLWLFQQQAIWKSVLGKLVPASATVIYERNTLWQLVMQHVSLTLLAMLLVLLVAVPLSLLCTRPLGQPFLPLLRDTVSIGQIFPPTAVLFLALPIFGFGARAAVLALFLYGLLPTVRGFLLGIETVSETLKDAATGCGMNARQLLWRIELPLALPAILSGVRTSLILILATATVAPLVGTGGLGVPIIAGLSTNNIALVIQGAVPVAILAVLSDSSMRLLERLLVRWR